MPKYKKAKAVFEAMTGYHFSIKFEHVEDTYVFSTLEYSNVHQNVRFGLFRGRTIPKDKYWSSFTCSRGIKALTALTIRTVLYTDDPEKQTLSGIKGSLASSLDYAIAKQPQWLIDLFGTDASGRSQFPRLVDIINPSRKRPGPVTISLKPTRLNSKSVSILVNGKPASNEQLFAILTNLEAQELTSPEERKQEPVIKNRETIAFDERSISAKLNGLPKHDSKVLDKYLETLRSRSSTILVLEDDAAGLQLAGGIPSILEHSYDNLRWLVNSAASSKLGFITLPSRAQDAEQAGHLFYDTARRLEQVVKDQKLSIIWATRFDSCLRGHSLSEMNAVKQALSEAGQPPFDLEVYAPSYYQQGRITFGGVQLVKVGARYSPISETEFAGMPGFEYSSPSVLEVILSGDMSHHRLSRSYNLSSDELRGRRPDKIAEQLSALPIGSRVVVDGVDEQDTITAAYVLYLLEMNGKRILYRLAPSLLLSMIGRRPDINISPSGIGIALDHAKSPGLIIVGSLSTLTKMQIRTLSERADIALVSMDPSHIIRSRVAQVRAVTQRCANLIKAGFTPLVTTRLWEDSPVMFPSPKERDLIMDSLAEVVHNLAGLPSWLLVKGSDTCLHVLRWGAKASCLYSIGSYLEGGTVSKIVSNESLWNDKIAVLFPGNVGRESSLLRLMETLTSDSSSKPLA